LSLRVVLVDQRAEWSVICAAALMTSAPPNDRLPVSRRGFIQSFLHTGISSYETGQAQSLKGHAD